MAAVGTSGPPDPIVAAKTDLRALILGRRRARSPAELAAAADAIRDRAVEALAPAPTVALYASTGTEPGTRPLLAALHERGTRVLLPVLLPDLDLDWAAYTGATFLNPGPRGTLTPAGPRLGPEALSEAVLVFVPGLAADRAGHRLGRGGGSYDRALRRISPTALVAVVLYDDELVDEVPVRGHDAPVHAVLTPAGLQPVGDAGDGDDPEGLGGESW